MSLSDYPVAAILGLATADLLSLPSKQPGFSPLVPQSHLHVHTFPQQTFRSHLSYSAPIGPVAGGSPKIP